MTPKAGAHGELCGILCIKAALEARGEDRRVLLVPESAHGTNPATAAFAGFSVESIPATAEGRVDLAAMKSKLGPHVAGVMITNPNTCGLFEREMKAISDAVHAAGGYVYCDGANFNAIVGRVRPGDLGIDAMHINLHKTFSTPHGGGGPGAGPVVLSEALAPYGPVPFTARLADGYDPADRGGGGRSGAAAKLRPHVRLPRPDGHVHPRADLYSQPRRRWPAPGRRGCGAQRQLRAAEPGRRARRAVRFIGAVHARSVVQRQRPGRAFLDAGHRQGPDRRGFPPDDGLFPAGGPRRDAGRADRDREQGGAGPFHRLLAQSGGAGASGRRSAARRAALRAAAAAGRDAGGEEAGAGVEGAGETAA